MLSNNVQRNCHCWKLKESTRPTFKITTVYIKLVPYLKIPQTCYQVWKKNKQCPPVLFPETKLLDDTYGKVRGSYFLTWNCFKSNSSCWKFRLVVSPRRKKGHTVLSSKFELMILYHLPYCPSRFYKRHVKKCRQLEHKRNVNVTDKVGHINIYVLEVGGIQ